MRGKFTVFLDPVRLRPLAGAILVLASILLSSIVSTSTVLASSTYKILDSTVSSQQVCTADYGGQWFAADRNSTTNYCQYDSGPDQNIDAFMHAGWLAECMYDHGDIFSSSEISTYSLYRYGGDATDFGYAISGDGDAKYACGESGAKSASEKLGYTDMLTMLDAIGCQATPDSGRDCRAVFHTTNDVNTNKPHIAKLLLTQRFGTDPTINNPARYIFYLSTFLRACSGSIVTNPTSADINEANSTDDTSKKVLIKTLGSDGTTMDNLVYAIGDGLDKGTRKISPTHNRSLEPFSLSTDGNHPGETTCGSLAAKANEYADSYLTWAKNHKVQANVAKEKSSQSNVTPTGGTSTCAVDGIGWLVCPVMTFLSKTMDDMLKFVSDNFLRVNSELLNTTSGTYQAWNTFRGYANVAFVVAFLIIIYSQITNVGVSSYGIKRMLPKLIISAILVNLSYYICQIAVDVSNLVGYGVKDVFDAAIRTVTAGRPSGGGIPSWLDTIGPILAISAGVLLALSLGVLGAALIATAMVVIILVARKAFIIILIVLAPLAFVAYLLPNTEQWFKKWWKALSTILLVFPIISLLFGGGKLAASVLNTAGASVDAKDIESTTLQLTALGVMVIPIFAVLPVLKGAMSAAGTLGAKLKGMGDKATGRVSSKAKEGRENSYLNRVRQIRKKNRSVRQAMVAGGSYTGRNPVQRARSAIFARANRSRLSGDAGDRMAAQGAGLEREEYEKSVKEAQQNQEESMNYDQRLAAARTGQHPDGRRLSGVERDAVVRTAMESGSFEERRQVLTGLGSMNDRQRRSAISVARSKGDGGVYGNNMLGRLEQNAVGDEAAIENQLNAGTRERIDIGEITPETYTRDSYTASYIAGQAPHATAAGQTALVESLRRYATTEQGSRMADATRGHVVTLTGPLP